MEFLSCSFTLSLTFFAFVTNMLLHICNLTPAKTAEKNGKEEELILLMAQPVTNLNIIGSLLSWQ